MTITEIKAAGPLTAQEEEQFASLYKGAFPKVAGFISRRQGSIDDARDIFHDSLVLYYEKTKNGLAPETASEEAYLLGIAKRLWIRKYNRQRSEISLEGWEESITIPDDYYPTVQTNRLLHLLEAAGERCLGLLKAFYYDHTPIPRIMKAFGYRNEHTASVQKFKCLEKLREKIKERALHYEDFIE